MGSTPCGGEGALVAEKEREIEVHRKTHKGNTFLNPVDR